MASATATIVVYYRHKARRKGPFYTRQLDELVRGNGFLGAEGLSLKFKTTSQRYCILIIQPRHKEAIEKTVGDMLAADWRGRFCRLDASGSVVL